MKRWLGPGLKLAGAAIVLLLIAGIVAPQITADRFAPAIQRSLERALGRKVTMGKVTFNVFLGPGFQVKDVVIHEDPNFGIEPLARMGSLELVPRILPLFTGHLAVASIRLDDANINLAKSGTAETPGHWNFEPLATKGAIASLPALHVRNGRINFKFGDTKSIYYLLNTDLDITPPGAGQKWDIQGSAEPARTDRPAQGLGSFEARGNWTATSASDHLKLEVKLERTGLAELTALLGATNPGVHGTVSGKVQLQGPVADIRINGRVNIEDVHRWDLLPQHGTSWPLDVQGQLNLVAAQFELESSSVSNTQMPLYLRFRVSDFLAQPRWGISANWNHFPVEPLLELARHMGLQLPPKLKLTGSVDGALGYASDAGVQGQMALHKAVLTVPDSSPVECGEAAILFGNRHIYMKPAEVRVKADETALLEADYAMDAETLDLSISTDGMDVASLRSQVALASVPWLEQLQKGQWSGSLHYRRAPAPAAGSGWTGKLEVAGAQIAVPGMANPVTLETARAQIDGAHVVVDRIEAALGKTSITGEYRYEPQSARPHRIKLVADEVDAAALEQQLAPALSRTRGILARALGRAAPLPDWLRQRNLEGTVQFGSLLLAGERLENVRARVLWEGPRVELTGVQARLEKAPITGKISVNLRGARPAYKVAGTVKGLAWQGGLLDAEATVDTVGLGAELLAGMKATGTFSGSDVEIGGPGAWKSATGAWHLDWARTGARLRFTDLQLSTGDEVYKGAGSTADDGRLIIVLTNGAREMRMSGSLAKLKVE